MALKLKGSAIQSNTVTSTQISTAITDKLTAAYNQANSAYTTANTANTAAASASGGFAKTFLVGL